MEIQAGAEEQKGEWQMTTDEYLETLSKDEMKHALKMFNEWRVEFGCPWADADENFPCPADNREDYECDDYCWIAYYVWMKKQE